jgi:hypothetical protein
MALAFYKSRIKKFLHLATGLLIAIALHSVFNLSIMKATGTGAFAVFFGVWLAIIVLALFFEKVKRIQPEGPITPNN